MRHQGLIDAIVALAKAIQFFDKNPTQHTFATQKASVWPIPQFYRFFKEPAGPIHMLGSTLGEGGMGTVDSILYTYKEKSPSARCLKKINPMRKKMQDEQIALAIVDPLYKDCSPAAYSAFLMTHHTGCDLMEYLYRTPLMTNAHILQLFKKMTLALQHVHKHGFLHRDVSLQNFMIDEQENVHLVDYGLAVQMKNIEEIYKGPPCGNMEYVCPDSKRGSFNNASDYYSLWVCFEKIIRSVFFNPNDTRISQTILRFKETIKNKKTDFSIHHSEKNEYEKNTLEWITESQKNQEKEGEAQAESFFKKEDAKKINDFLEKKAFKDLHTFLLKTYTDNHTEEQSYSLKVSTSTEQLEAMFSALQYACNEVAKKSVYDFKKLWNHMCTYNAQKDHLPLPIHIARYSAEQYCRSWISNFFYYHYTPDKPQFSDAQKLRFLDLIKTLDACVGLDKEEGIERIIMCHKNLHLNYVSSAYYFISAELQMNKEGFSKIILLAQLLDYHNNGFTDFYAALQEFNKEPGAASAKIVCEKLHQALNAHKFAHTIPVLIQHFIKKLIEDILKKERVYAPGFTEALENITFMEPKLSRTCRLS